MQIVNQEAKIVNISHDNPLNAIEMAARNCYQSEINPDKTDGFIRGLIKRGHWSPMEHVTITFELITDRGVLAEITRHRLASYSVESTRYVNYKEGIDVIRPIGMETIFSNVIWEDAMADAEVAYIRMIENNCSPQIARSVLPNSLKTKIIMTINLRSLYNLFELRLASGAHPQIKDLAKKMLKETINLVPIIFDKFLEDKHKNINLYMGKKVICGACNEPMKYLPSLFWFRCDSCNRIIEPTAINGHMMRKDGYYV